MKVLVDTHLLLWAAYEPGRLSSEATEVLIDETNDLLFSAGSIWETAIKASLGRDDFSVDVDAFHRGLVANGYTELAMTGEHGADAARLPMLHRDPFDRLLVAQARTERATLLTHDHQIARYGGPVLIV